ncbi:hypothetical protein Tco_0727086 [Tanacetum coccineum]|uniref:Uncharacterized protein n=1 Tax=Tanacetum coccineum TaxID=301880 RepID=A0ABQ4YI13_9ASTR
MALNEEISNLNIQLLKEKSTVSSLLEEKKRLKSDFKIREDELLDKQIQLENKIKELDNILVKTGQSIQTMHMLSPKPDSFYHSEHKMALGYQNPFYLKQAQQKQQSLYNGKVLLEKHDPLVVYDSEETLQLSQENTLDPLPQKLENENVELEFQVQNYEKEIVYLKTTYKNLFNSINVTRTQTKLITDLLQNKLRDTIYENAKLRAQLFDKFVVRQPNAFPSECQNVSKTRIPQKVDKSKNLSNPVTSNSVPTTNESEVVDNDKVIVPRMFRINPFKNSREEKFVPNKSTKASGRTNSITVSQPLVITRKVVNSNSHGFSSTGVDITTKTRRP